MTEGVAILGGSKAEAFGLRAEARLAAQLRRLGAEPRLEGPGAEGPRPEGADGPAQGPAGGTAGPPAMILRGDHVYDATVLRALLSAAPGTWLVDGAGRALGARIGADVSAAGARATLSGTDPRTPPAQGARRTPEALAGGYDPKLRRRNAPFALPAEDPRAERAIFDASYKGVTDFVTKHAWPPLAFPATRWCARAGITPNQVTVASGALVLVAFALFWVGAFGWGLAAAWAMTFLDTVDGKLARTTLSSSRFGDVLDHGIDLVHPPFWWWAWAVGCAAAGAPLGDGGLAVAVIVAGYVLQRVEEGVFIARFGLEMHVWRRFDSLFRQITARRNPNLVILTLAALAGAPRAGLILVAVWTGLCFLVHLLRIAQAWAAARRGPLKSWMAEG